MKFIATDAYFVYRPNYASCHILYRMFGYEIIMQIFVQVNHCEVVNMITAACNMLIKQSAND
jgi:hypothetical protein